MDEILDILDENGRFTGKTDIKSRVHKKGLFHPIVHIWCYTEDGAVLVQQRGINKETFPLYWDVSVAGHVAAGETIISAGLREAKEEIGIVPTATELHPVGVFKSVHRHPERGWFDREFHHSFVYPLTASQVTQLKPQDSEVAQLRMIPFDTFREHLNHVERYHYVPHSAAYFQQVLHTLGTLL